MVTVSLLLYDPEICEVPLFISETFHRAGRYKVAGFAYHKTYFIAYLQNEA